jgi:hypothetical protein
MFRLRKTLTLMAAIVGAVVLGAPTQALADFELRWSIDGGTTFTGGVKGGTVTGTIGTPLSVTVDGLNITAGSSSTTNPTFSGIDISVTGNPSAGALDVVLEATMTGVQTAPPPQLLHYNF